MRSTSVIKNDTINCLIGKLGIVETAVYFQYNQRTF